MPFWAWRFFFVCFAICGSQTVFPGCRRHKRWLLIAVDRATLDSARLTCFFFSLFQKKLSFAAINSSQSLAGIEAVATTEAEASVGSAAFFFVARQRAVFLKLARAGGAQQQVVRARSSAARRKTVQTCARDVQRAVALAVVGRRIFFCWPLDLARSRLVCTDSNKSIRPPTTFR